MLPSVQISKTDGNLGVVNQTDKILAVIGSASAGTKNVAGSYTNKNDVTSNFVSGPLVEAAAYLLNLGIPLVLIRSDPTTPGVYGTIDHSGVAGTAAISAGSSAPDADYDVIVKIITGGTIGTGPIIFQYSLDAGVNYSQPQDLGSSLTMTLARGISFTLVTAGTFVTGDVFKVTTSEPVISTTDLATSLTALSSYSGEWLRLLALVEMDTTIGGQLDLFAKSFHADGKYPEVITNTRARHVSSSESRATYQTALATIAAGVQSTEVSCCADRCEIVSVVDGRRLRMRPAIPFAARTMLIDDSQDAAARADGSLPGVFVETANGDRNYHDERRYPGLDDLGFTTLRTWGGRPVTPGVYVTNPRLLSGVGSDYRYFQLSAIVNRVIEDAFTLLQPKLSMSVLCDTTTGKIREDVAQSIDDAMNGELRTRYVLSSPGRTSGILFKLSRTDDVLGTDTIHFDINIVPLAYVKHFIGKTGLVRKLPS